jgi:hypothetical protein
MTQGRIMFGKIAASALLAMGSATAFATTPVAHVYVQTTKGVNLYNAAPNGQLTLASGSPFKTVGLMVGTNGKFFFSNGTNLIHVYAMNTSTGAIGKEVANIDTSLYSGSECGTTGPTFLDHTGQYIYLEHDNARDEYQDLILLLDPVLQGQRHDRPTDLPGGNRQPVRRSLLPSSKGLYRDGQRCFCICDLEEGYGSNYITGFHRESGGALNIWSGHETDPPTYGSDWGWLQFGVAVDPTNHIATIAVQEQDVPMGPYAPPLLASYTVDTQGNISTTNIWQTMVKPVIYPTSLNMSPSGKLLAAAGNISQAANQGISTESPACKSFTSTGPRRSPSTAAC